MVLSYSLEQITTVLDKLSTEAHQYDKDQQTSKHPKKIKLKQPLFQSQSYQLTFYVQESQALLANINGLINGEHSNSLIAFQCDKLVAQCQAIKKVLTQKTKTLAHQTLSERKNLAIKLSKHHEYRQRFETKIRQLTNMSAQDRVNYQVSKLEQRLSQCNKAIYHLEKQIEEHKKYDHQR